MALKEILEQIDELQSKINSHGKLSDDVLKKINYKFRLDWNYHSNAMEGNSLTKEETRSVMINNITVEGKPLKDVIEIRGHDEIITSILKIGKGEQRISEKRIKEIHKAIMHEDDPKQALKIGEWKMNENHIINYKKEKYDFVSPADVPDAIHDLLNFFNSEYDKIKLSKKDAIHPAVLAFQFHLKYVTIHPFFDGNGRTSRILTNLILIMFGYPPVIVKVSDKDTYNRYLGDIQGYGGSPDLFYEFMSKLLVKSQELVLTAIEGGDIEEPDDLDKKLLLLDKNLSGIKSNDQVKERFGKETFFKTYDEWISDMLEVLITTAQKFNKFFDHPDHHIFSNYSMLKFIDEHPDAIVSDFRTRCRLTEKQLTPTGMSLGLVTSFRSFVKGGVNTFDCSCSVRIIFDNLKYSITIEKFTDWGYNTTKFFVEKRLLHQPVTSKEIEDLNKQFGDSIYENIDFHMKKNGIK